MNQTQILASAPIVRRAVHVVPVKYAQKGLQSSLVVQVEVEEE